MIPQIEQQSITLETSSPLPNKPNRRNVHQKKVNLLLNQNSDNEDDNTSTKSLNAQNTISSVPSTHPQQQKSPLTQTHPLSPLSQHNALLNKTVGPAGLKIQLSPMTRVEEEEMDRDEVERVSNRTFEEETPIQPSPQISSRNPPKKNKKLPRFNTMAQGTMIKFLKNKSKIK